MPESEDQWRTHVPEGLPTDRSEYLSLPEIARLYGLHWQTVYTWKLIPAVLIPRGRGVRRYFLKVDVTEYAARQSRLNRSAAQAAAKTRRRGAPGP